MTQRRISDVAMQLRLSYDQTRRLLLTGELEGGRDRDGNLYIEQRSLDEYREQRHRDAETLSKEDAAKRIGGGVTVTRVNQLVKQGKLKVQYVNNEWRVTPASIDAYLAEGTVISPSNPIRISPSKA